MALFTGLLWILGSLTIPETYAPVILRQRAKKLSKLTGNVYMSKTDIQQGPKTFSSVLGKALSRPWALLFMEPIVLLLSIYMAIIYGTLYMLFAAYPIVFQEKRGWSAGIGGLAFIGVAVGMALAVAYTIWDDRRYVKISDKYKGFAPPEARLPPCMVGAIAVPIGLFWFAWTDSPSINFMVSIIGSAPFGFGMVVVFLGVTNYLLDAYTIYAASVLAANSVIRSIFGAVFPLFTSAMYENLGIHWAASIPAFLALACVPFPSLFYKYGPAVRTRCKYAAEADAFMKQIKEQTLGESSDDKDSIPSDHQEEKDQTREKDLETDLEKQGGGTRGDEASSGPSATA